MTDTHYTTKSIEPVQVDLRVIENVEQFSDIVRIDFVPGTNYGDRILYAIYDDVNQATADFNLLSGKQNGING